MKSIKENDSLLLHLQTAELLIKGIKESVDMEDSFYPGPQNSRESIKRRCVQARQELLRVYQEVNNA